MTATLLFDAAAGFEAARSLAGVPASGRSSALHGHSFVAKVRAAMPLASSDFQGGQADQLLDLLSAAIAPFDYRHLNDELAEPSDANIARAILQRLPLETVQTLGIRSAPRQGVDLDHTGAAQLWRRYAFESAHRLPHVKIGHKCGRMHGHSFEAVLHANAADALSYATLDAAWAPIAAELDYACLNDIAGLENPTSEMLSSWIWRALKPALPALSSVTVFETASCGAYFDGFDYRIWKEFGFDSALRLSRAPENDRRRRLHGHTYTLRLHLSAPLDQVMGWMLDFGDVKELFKPVLRQLDHQPLHEILQPIDPNLGELLQWIKRQSVALLPQLDRIDLQQSSGCGALLHWGGAAPIRAI